MADLDLIGTRLGDGVPAYARLVEQAFASGAERVCIASAYWDAPTLTAVADLAAAHDCRAQLLLWTLGGRKSSWKHAAFVRTHPSLDVRFVESPDDAGIFHVKLGGVGSSDAWSCAIVGSGNLTTRGLGGNVELGVIIRGATPVLDELRIWFDAQFAAATRAADIDWERAIERAPAKHKPDPTRDGDPIPEVAVRVRASAVPPAPNAD